MNILNTYSHLVGYTPGLSIKAIIFFVICIALSVTVYIKDKNGRYWYTDFGLFIIAILASISFIAGILATCKAHPKYQTIYETTISETVTFNEVYNKYDILDKRGDIYVLTDKNSILYETPRYPTDD